jgi:hypothetical protein
MINTIIILHGISIELRYEWFSPDKIEWILAKKHEEMVSHELRLLDILLRRHYNNKICLLLWDEHQAQVYEEDAKAAARAEDIPF